MTAATNDPRRPLGRRRRLHRDEELGLKILIVVGLLVLAVAIVAVMAAPRHTCSSTSPATRTSTGAVLADVQGAC